MYKHKIRKLRLIYKYFPIIIDIIIPFKDEFEQKNYGYKLSDVNLRSDQINDSISSLMCKFHHDLIYTK